MIVEELPAIRTPVDVEELALAFCSAYRQLTQLAPSRDTILVLLSQSALETGRWKSCMCFNLGNIKSRDGDGRSFTYFRCNEVVNGKVVWFDKPSPVARFRAFHTLTEGAVDHIGFLAKSQRYAKAWSAAVEGDPAKFVDELKAAGYFTADLWPYKHSVCNIFAQFKAQLQFEVPPAAPVIDDELRARILHLVDMTSADATEEFRRGTALPDEDETIPPTDPNAA